MISAWSRLLDLVAPRYCPICQKRLSPTEEVVCSVCNLHLPRTQLWRSPLSNPMNQLFWGRISCIEKAAAFVYYEPGAESARLIEEMKYRHHPEIALRLGEVIADELGPDDFFSGIEVIVPVPLTKARQRHRGFNQSLELARGISQKTSLRVERRALSRIHFRASQTRKGPLQRAENVETAFRLCHPEGIVGRHVLLVDDICTTGATLSACAKELIKGGAAHISLLTIGLTKS